MSNSKEWHHQYYLKHRERILERQRGWYISHREYVSQQGKLYRVAHKEQTELAHKRWLENNLWRVKHSKTLREAVIRLEILRHYSPNLVCGMCGYADARALTLDHINGNGHEMRRAFGSHERYWIRKNDYPEGYQVLCMNCQFIKDKKYSTKLEEAMAAVG